MSTHRPSFTNLFFTLAMVLLCSSAVLAQTDKEKLSVKPSDGRIGTAIKNKIYYYPTFQAGHVQFISGVKTSGVLNYNMLSGEFEFINSKKDTLALDNMHTVNRIVVSNDTFYYDLDNQELLKQLDDVNGHMLLVKEKYTLSNVKNVGAMGIESSTASPTSTTNTDHINNNLNSLKANETLEFKVKSYYYLQNNGKYVPATRSNILKLYPNHSTNIKSYIKEQKLNLNTYEGVAEVLHYAAQL